MATWRWPESPAQQAMVSVARVCGENRHPAHITARHRNQRLKNGQAQGENRPNVQHRAGGLARSQEGDAGQREANEEAACVAQEDAGGMEVEHQKGEQTAGKGDREQRDKRCPVESGHDAQRRAADEGNARGQAVQAVNDVEGVGQADQPEQRQRRSQINSEFNRAKDGDTDGMNAVAGGTDENADGDLGEQFVARTHPAHVVNHADAHNCDAANGQHCEFHSLGGESAKHAQWGQSSPAHKRRQMAPRWPSRP